MKVLELGHRYELSNFEHPANIQVVQFIHKEQHNGELLTMHDGTTNEEILEMLINRLSFLHSKLPSRESAIVKTKLQECLMWLEHRTRNRRERGVEGTMQP